MTEWLGAWKLGQWNTARIRVEGRDPRIRTWINGLQVCDFNASTTNNEKYDRELIFEKLGPRGSIGVQVHGGKGWPSGAKCAWRNIKVRPL